MLKQIKKILDENMAKYLLFIRNMRRKGAIYLMRIMSFQIKVLLVPFSYDLFPLKYFVVFLGNAVVVIFPGKNLIKQTVQDVAKFGEDKVPF